MSAIQWEEFQKQTQRVCVIISVLTNPFTIYLITYHSPKEMGSYKYLMIVTSIFEIVYSFIDGLLVPIVQSYGSSFLIIVNHKSLNIDPNSALFATGVYCSFFGASVALFSVHFIYRYWVVAGSHILNYFQSWNIFYFLIIPLTYGVVWGTVTYYLGGPSEVTTNFVKYHIYNLYNWTSDEYVYIGPHIYPQDDNGHFYLNIPSFIGVLVGLFIVGSSIFTSIFFAAKCYFKLADLFNIPKTSVYRKNLQSQIFYALLTQALIPVILMHLPAIILLLVPLFNHELGTTAGILSVTIAFYPVIDPIPTILIIKSYRTAAFRLIRCKWGKLSSRKENYVITAD